MKSLTLRTLAAASLAAACAVPAHAVVVDFEDVAPTLLSGGTISSGGFGFASSGTGFSGVDNASAFSIFGNAPSNSSGQFLFALNNDAITLNLDGGRLLGLDAAFIAPLPIAAGTSAGELQISAVTTSGVVEFDADFGVSDANGGWGFFSVGLGALTGLSVQSVTFTACLFDGNGGCTRDLSLSQFALDNVRVPEPGSAALALAALGLLAATRRRQAR